MLHISVGIWGKVYEWKFIGESSRVSSLFSVSSALHHHALSACIVATAIVVSQHIRTVAASDSFVRRHSLHFVATQWLVPTTGFRASSRLRLNGPLEQKGQPWPTSHIKVINVHGCQRIRRDFRYIVTHPFLHRFQRSARANASLSKHARQSFLILRARKKEEKKSRRGERKIETHFRQRCRSPRGEYVERTICVSMKNSVFGAIICFSRKTRFSFHSSVEHFAI